MQTQLDQLRIEGATLSFESKWCLLSVRGEDVQTFLHAQVTANILDLNANGARLCARLNRSGRVQSFFFFLKSEDLSVGHILVPAQLEEALLEDLNKFIIMEDVIVEKSPTQAYFSFGIKGHSLRGYDGNFYGLPGVFHLSDQKIEDSKNLSFAREFKILSGFPEWGESCHSEMLVNETTLNELAVDYKKGCFLGQETVAKVQNNRGASFYPTLLEINENTAFEFAKGMWLYKDSKKTAQLIDWCLIEKKIFALVHLRREERIESAQLDLLSDDNQVLSAIVRYIPYFKSTTFQEMSEELFEVGGNAFRDGDEAFAEDLLRKAILFDPENEDAYESLGVILGRQERYEEAIQMMDQLSRVNPKSVMAHSNKSLYLMRMGKIEEAEKEKAEATFKSFQYFGDEAQRKKEESEKDKKRMQERSARESMFKQVLEIDEVDEIALYGLAEILFEENKAEDSLNHLTKLIKNHPRHTKAHLLLGKIYINRAENEQAKEILKLGIEIAKKKGELMPANEMQGLLNKL